MPRSGHSDTTWPLPTTVAFAPELSVPAILTAIRQGHVFVDLTASRNRLLEVTATSTNQTAHMGDPITISSGASLSLTVHAVACEGLQIQFLLDGKPSTPPTKPSRPTGPATETSTGSKPT